MRGKASVKLCAAEISPWHRNDQLDLYEAEVGYEEAIFLSENLKPLGGKLYLATDYIDLHFYLYPDNTVEAEVFDERDGFSAIAAKLDLNTCKKMIEMAFKNERFGDLVPITDEHWWTKTNV